ncbi:CLUMA_CG015528, isoform A [Clunio marinus]|uniref:CLUMA_CG015528, isoform A n=1 Tax=Clunio marinus TaxID=568069 RepID=A0A1J1IP56_9DIPT|nr:CLUMA_CG015528, isoform A [Clunio marinus]
MLWLTLRHYLTQTAIVDLNVMGIQDRIMIVEIEYERMLNGLSPLVNQTNLEFPNVINITAVTDLNSTEETTRKFI